MIQEIKVRNQINTHHEEGRIEELKVQEIKE